MAAVPFVMPVGKEMGCMTIGIVRLMAKVWVLVPSLLSHIIIDL